MRRSPTLATATSIVIIILTSLCPLILAQVPSAEESPSSNVCRPFGTCEPCPDDALDQPFCQPFGNRRLMHCIELDSESPISPPPSSHQKTTPHVHIRPPSSNSLETPPVPNPPQRRQGATPAWESCGRIVSQERADFWEFVACNVVFAVIALCLVFARSKRIQLLQARQLAARIGLTRDR